MEASGAPDCSLERFEREASTTTERHKSSTLLDVLTDDGKARIIFMLFETKIALVIRDDLASWQKMNVAAFLASGIAASYPESIGEPYTASFR